MTHMLSFSVENFSLGLTESHRTCMGCMHIYIHPLRTQAVSKRNPPGTTNPRVQEQTGAGAIESEQQRWEKRWQGRPEVMRKA